MSAKNPHLARCSILFASGGVAVALMGCGGGGSSSQSHSAGAAASTAVASSSNASVRSAPKSSKASKPGSVDARRLVAAGTTAREKVGRGTVASVDAERRGAIWEVDIVTSDGVEHELHVSHNGAKVLSGPRTTHLDSEDRAENRQEVRRAKLNYEDAAEMVLRARHGRITELNLDDHRGRIVWKAEVQHSTAKYEVKIDAAAGEVIQNAPDCGDDRDHD